MPLNPVDIANQALASFGGAANRLQSFDDSTAAGSAVALAYSRVIDGLLSEYPWSFVRQTVPLQRVDAVVDSSGFIASGWRYAYVLPSDLLCPPRRYLDAPQRHDYPLRVFDVQGNLVYCDASAVWAVVDRRVDPAFWPPYFVSAAVAVLAAELVMPISGNSGQVEALKAEAWGTPQEDRKGGKLGAAMRVDARNSGTLSIRANPLIDARH